MRTKNKINHIFQNRDVKYNAVKIENEDLPFDNEDGLIHTRQLRANEYFINIDEDIDAPDKYRKIYNTLRNASENDTIIFLINSDGGIVNSFVQLFNYMMMTEAHTAAEVYNASSAGSLLALSCDHVYCGEFSTMMIHNIQWGVFGSTDKIKTQFEFTEKFGHQIIQKIYQGFLNPSELETVLKGSKEIWLTDTDIRKRLENWTPIRYRKVKDEVKIVRSKEKNKAKKIITG